MSLPNAHETSELPLAAAVLGYVAAGLIVLWECWISLGHIVGGLLIPPSPPEASADLADDLRDTAIAVLPHALILICAGIAIAGLWTLAARRRGAAAAVGALALWLVVGAWLFLNLQ